MVVRSIDVHRACGDIGFPTPATRSPFLAAPAVSLSAPSPVLLRTRDHPPVDFTPSTECFPSLTCRRAPSCDGSPGASLGVAFPLRDISRPRRRTGFPGPAPFRPRRFSRPRRFHPRMALRVYFTPQPRPGFSLQGVSLSHSQTGSSPACALSSVDDGRLLELPPAPSPVAPPSGL
jgi:hypothetical protein